MKSQNSSVIIAPIGEPETKFSGKIHSIIHQKMQIGPKQKTFEKVQRAPGVRLLIVDIQGSILLTKEYRAEIQDFDFRLPGGKVYDSLDDFQTAKSTNQPIEKAALKAAKNEALEEAGIKIKDISLIHTSHCGATIDWTLYYFIVNDFEDLPEQQNDSIEENIEVHWFAPMEVEDMLNNLKIKEDRSQGVLYRYLNGMLDNR